MVFYNQIAFHALSDFNLYNNIDLGSLLFILFHYSAI